MTKINNFFKNYICKNYLNIFYNNESKEIDLDYNKNITLNSILNILSLYEETTRIGIKIFVDNNYNEYKEIDKNKHDYCISLRLKGNKFNYSVGCGIHYDLYIRVYNDIINELNDIIEKYKTKYYNIDYNIKFDEFVSSVL